MVFPGIMHGCESWTIKKAECWRIDVFVLWYWKKIFESLQKEIKQVNPKGNQSWVFIGTTDAKAEALIIRSLDMKCQLIKTETAAGKDWRQKEKGTTEDEMARWHHQLNAHECEQALEDGEGQGSLVAAVHGVTRSQTWLSNWRTLNGN